MLSKTEIIEKAHGLGFDEIGFTTADPFETHKEVLLERKEAYAHLMANRDLIAGTSPKNILPEAKSIIVLVHMYLKESFDPMMEAHFGRFYIDEDRIIKKERVRRTPMQLETWRFRCAARRTPRPETPESSRPAYGAALRGDPAWNRLPLP